MMKINRLLETTILLLNRKTVTAKELAERFSVSTRTIYRDIEILSSSGVPVYMQNGRGGGISLLDDYALNKALLSDKESEDLLTALKTMQAARYPEIDAVLEKVGAIFKNVGDTDWVTINFSGWSSSPNERGKFETMKNAIFKKRLIEFDYINADGQKSSRKVEPERFYFNAHTWYLTAFCLLKNERRIFRLSRIKNVRALDKTFEKRSITVEQRRPQGYAKPWVHLKLRFSRDVLYRVYDEFDESHITFQPDGSALVDVAFPEDEWVYGFVLSFGASVQVLEPTHVRLGVIARMRAALETYEKASFNMTDCCHDGMVSSSHPDKQRREIMNIEMTAQAVQPTIYIRERMTLETMAAAFDRNFGKLAAYVAETGAELAGAPYAAYMNSDVNDMDTEFGFPLAAPLPEKGEIKAGQILPFETALTAIHKGGYDTLHLTYDALYKRMADEKLTMIGPHYDFYISDPANTAAEEILTKVVLPVSAVPMVFCQSCGMPLTADDTKGTEKDGSKSEDYCVYCYKDGAFAQDVTMDEMIEINVQYLDNWNPGMSPDEARAQLKTYLPTLKRWSK